MEKAQEYPDCLAIVERLVKPERAKVNRAAHRQRWWRFGDARPALRRAIVGLDRVLVIARVSDTLQPLWVSADQVFHDKLAVFAYDDDGHFGLLFERLPLVVGPLRRYDAAHPSYVHA